jgi:predicted dehydrogenase
MRFGVIGLGWAARALQLPALKSIPSVEVVGGCDPSAAQRISWERETGIPAFSSLEELVEQAAPEAVVIATPPDLHEEQCIQALEFGLHVVCEKPFVVSVAEADRVLAAAERTGRRVAVNHEFREKPIFKAIQQRVARQEDGRLAFCQIWQLMYLPPWEEQAPWRAAMADRALLEGGVHLVDLMITIFGTEPEAVYARHSTGTEAERRSDAINLLTLEFPHGRLAQITIDRLCRGGTRYVELRADCERATLRASAGGRASVRVGMKRAERAGVQVELASGGLAWVERGLHRRTLARNSRDAAQRATAALLAQIVNAFEQGIEPPSSGHEARAALAVIEAAYESARTGRRVELATTLAGTPALP